MKISQQIEKSLALLLLSLLSLLQSITYGASASVYGSFLQCLSNHSNPSHQISPRLFSPTNSSYPSILKHYIRNLRFDRPTTPKPTLIFTPLHQLHVQAAIICSKDLNLHIKIRSGGHDFEGLSYVSNDTFIILDMFHLRKIKLDIKHETAWVQCGATIGELYYRIWEKSGVHTFPAGVCTTVGIGGHISGGGYGNLMRKYGMAIDNILDAKIVDVNGKILNRKSMGKDLFWAIRGGGGASFGVILSYKLKLVRVPETVSVFRIYRTLEENLTEIVYRWQYVGDKIDRDLFMRISLQPIKEGVKTVRGMLLAMFLGNCSRLVDLMNEKLPELGLIGEDCEEMSWVESALFWASFDNSTSPQVLLNRTVQSVRFQKRKSDYLQKPILKDGWQEILKKMIELGDTALNLNPYGGRMSEIPDWETPFPHRAGNIFKFQYAVNWQEDSVEAEGYYINQTRVLHRYMTPFVSKSPRGAFLNYRDLDIGINHNGKDAYFEGRVYGVKYFMKNFERLVKVKSRVDPDNFFRNEQSIPVLPSLRKKNAK